MAQTVTIDAKMFNQLLQRIDTLSKDIKAIKTRIFDEEPAYGSEKWWKSNIAQAEKDFKAGKGKKFDSVEDAVQWLNS